MKKSSTTQGPDAKKSLKCLTTQGCDVTNLWYLDERSSVYVDTRGPRAPVSCTAVSRFQTRDHTLVSDLWRNPRVVKKILNLTRQCCRLLQVNMHHASCVVKYSIGNQVALLQSTNNIQQSTADPCLQLWTNLESQLNSLEVRFRQLPFAVSPNSDCGSWNVSDYSSQIYLFIRSTLNITGYTAISVLNHPAGISRSCVCSVQLTFKVKQTNYINHWIYNLFFYFFNDCTMSPTPGTYSMKIDKTCGSSWLP